MTIDNQVIERTKRSLNSKAIAGVIINVLIGSFVVVSGIILAVFDVATMSRWNDIVVANPTLEPAEINEIFISQYGYSLLLFRMITVTMFLFAPFSIMVIIYSCLFYVYEKVSYKRVAIVFSFFLTPLLGFIPAILLLVSKEFVPYQVLELKKAEDLIRKHSKTTKEILLNQ